MLKINCYEILLYLVILIILFVNISMIIDFFYIINIMQDFLENLDLNTYNFTQLINDALNILNTVDYLDTYTRTFYEYLTKILYLRYDVWKFLLKPSQKKDIVYLIFICFHLLNVKDFFKENIYTVKLSSTIDLLMYQLDNCESNITFEMYVVNCLYEVLKYTSYTIQDVKYKSIQLKELAYTIHQHDTILFKEIDELLKYIMYGYKIVKKGDKCELIEHPYMFEFIEIKEEPKFSILSLKTPFKRNEWITHEPSYWNCLNSYELEYFINDDIDGFLDYIMFEEKTDENIHEWFTESLFYKSIKIFKHLYLLENFFGIIRECYINPVWNNEMYRLLQSLYSRNNYSEEDFIKMCDIDFIIKSNNYELLNYLIEKELFSLRTELIIYIPLIFKDKYPVMSTVHKFDYVIETSDNVKFYLPKYDAKDHFECAMTILNYNYNLL